MLGHVTVALVEPTYSLNVGYVARVMKNFGVPRLILVNSAADLQAARKYASHGGEVLDNAQSQTFAQLLDDSGLLVGTTAIPARRKTNLKRDAVTPSRLAQIIGSQTGKVTILLGRDTVGLNTEELQACDVVVTIPTKTRYRTLNISHALAILLYELTRVRPTRHRRLAGRPDRQRTIEYATRLAELAGYQKHRIRLLRETLRLLLGRSTPTPKEVYILMGVLRKAVQALTKQVRYA